MSSASTSGPSIPVAHERVRKGELKMRGLAAATRRFFDECLRVQGSVVPGPALEIEHIDPVINAIDEALVAIRTLDREIFEPSHLSYAALRNANAQGRVVRALTPLRDSAVHHADVVDPNLARAVGPDEHGCFIVFPVWKPAAELPVQVFQPVFGKKAGQANLQRVAHHDATIAGRFVLDTLLDAFAFFDYCDPTVADRDAHGRLVDFPLPPLPIGGIYVRLAPDWPDQETVSRKIRREVTDTAPTGERREIVGRLNTGRGTVWCGYTTVTANRRSSFTEDELQIVRDLRAGYCYEMRIAGALLEVTHRARRLIVGGQQIDDLEFPNWTNDTAEPWASWWELCTTDANYYRDQRRPR